MRLTDIVFEQQLNEYREVIDVHHYGGWLDEQNRAHYVADSGHEDYVDAQGFYGVADAYQKGWVRFLTAEMPHAFGVEGTLQRLQESFAAWFPTARRAH